MTSIFYFYGLNKDPFGTEDCTELNVTAEGLVCFTDINPHFCKMQNIETTLDTKHTVAPKLALVRSTELQETHAADPVSINDTDTTEDEDDNHDTTEDERKMKRILANRGSARASYLRRKKMISELQASVHNQSTRNAAMEAENKALRNEVKELRQQVRELLVRHSPLEPRTSDMMLDIAIPGAVSMSLPESHSNVSPHLLARAMASQHAPISSDVISLLARRRLVGSLTGVPPNYLGIY